MKEYKVHPVIKLNFGQVIKVEAENPLDAIEKVRSMFCDTKELELYNTDGTKAGPVTIGKPRWDRGSTAFTFDALSSWAEWEE